MQKHKESALKKWSENKENKGAQNSGSVFVYSINVIAKENKDTQFFLKDFFTISDVKATTC